MIAMNSHSPLVLRARLGGHRWLVLYKYRATCACRSSSSTDLSALETIKDTEFSSRFAPADYAAFARSPRGQRGDYDKTKSTGMAYEGTAGEIRA